MAGLDAQHSLPVGIFPDQEIQERPIYHLAPPQGWLNDPNGPFYHHGKYHM